MRYAPLTQQASVVIIGRFNPAIFSPDWLVRNGLLDASELKATKISIIHPEIAEFELGGFAFSVQTQRFQVTTSDDPFVKLSDLVSKLFSEMLPYTPMSQLGITYAIHFVLDNTKQRHRLGRALAPIQPWGKWGQSLEHTEPTKIGGLRSLVLEEYNLANRAKGYRRVQIEPSLLPDIANTMTGVFMSVNDHFEIAEAKLGQDAAAAISWMTANFDSSILTAKEIVSDMKEFAGRV